jgi:arabinan endo-1,5-alpha-L-arabinosidase
VSALRWSTWGDHDPAVDRPRPHVVRPDVIGPYRRLLGPEPGERPWYVNDHTFFRDPAGTWHLVGITHDEPFAPFDETEFVHATAPDLHGPWQRHEPALVADPNRGEHHLWAPHVIDHDGRLWMYYCAGGDTKDRYRIHLATSDDGWTWVRHPANPMVVDGFEARDPMVRRVDDRWVMYYTATSAPTGGAHVVAAVESDDLVHWTGRREVYRDRSEGTGAGPTESPFVVEVDGTWLLFIGPDHEGLVGSKERTGSLRPGVLPAHPRARERRPAARFDAGGEVGRHRLACGRARGRHRRLDLGEPLRLGAGWGVPRTTALDGTRPRCAMSAHASGVCGQPCAV